MKTKILILSLFLSVMPFLSAIATDDGATLFKTNCGACHSVGKGKLVGPDLKDVQNRHTEAWILKWVKSSQALVNAGDKDAAKLFADNNQIVMPDQPLKDDDIKAILGYIKAGGDQPVTATTTAETKAPETKGPDAITVATQKASADKEDSGSLLSSFSFAEYMMMFLMGLLLLVIYVMSLTIKSLTERIKEKNQTVSA